MFLFKALHFSNVLKLLVVLLASSYPLTHQFLLGPLHKQLEGVILRLVKCLPWMHEDMRGRMGRTKGGGEDA